MSVRAVARVAEVNAASKEQCSRSIVRAREIYDDTDGEYTVTSIVIFRAPMRTFSLIRLQAQRRILNKNPRALTNRSMSHACSPF